MPPPPNLIASVSKTGQQNVAATGSSSGGSPLCGCLRSGDAQGGGADKEKPLLPPQQPDVAGRATLVLDLDETLVHSSFRFTAGAHLVIPVEIDGMVHSVYVLLRPHVKDFLDEVAKYYEVVIFTASLSKYADPLLDELDPEHRLFSFRLFREGCVRRPQGFVKDLSKLGRDMRRVLIIDNSPVCYSLQPQNAIPIRSWFDDTSDTDLKDLLPILEALSQCADIPEVMQAVYGEDAYVE